MRTVDGAWWFDADDAAWRAAVLGAMAVAQLKYPIRIHAFTFMSNHYHAIYSFDDPRHFERYLGHFHAAVARLVNRGHARTGPVWACAPHTVPILLEPEAQLRRLRYVLGQAVRAGVAAHPREWKGASSTEWLLDGAPLTGRHVNHTQRALDGRNLAEPPPEAGYARDASPVLSPLPCFAGMPEEAWRAQVAELAADIAAEAEGRPSRVASVQDAADGAPPVVKSPPPKRKRAPKVHAASRTSAEGYLALRRDFDQACSDARAQQLVEAERAAAGHRARFVSFPLWAFPAAGPCDIGSGCLAESPINSKGRRRGDSSTRP